MSLLDQLMTDLAVPLIDEFLAGDVDYLRPDGSPGGSYRATIGGERSVEVLVGESRSWKQVRTVSFFRDDGLPFWQPNAAIGTFDVDGVEYAYESVTSITAAFAVVELVRLGAIEKTRPEYRRK